MEKGSWRIPPEPISEDKILETLEAEVVIVGAGHAGVAVARTCAELGLSVRVIETMVEKNYWGLWHRFWTYQFQVSPFKRRSTGG